MRKHVQARRDRLREIAEREFAARCQHCKVKLEAVRIQMGERFCSEDCRESDATFQARWAAARARVEDRR